MTKFIVIGGALSVIIMVGCSADSEGGSFVDSGDLDISSNIKEVGISTSNDANTGSDDSGTRCERGTYLDRENDRCTSLTGCSAIALTAPDRGCVFYVDTIGRSTTAECETNADCLDSPYGPNCILRVCHEQEPCSAEGECDEALVCINGAICMPPRSACTTDDDCMPPGQCLTFEGLCG